MNAAADYRKMACPFCAGRIEFEAGAAGALADCPHCAQEIVLGEVPPVLPSPVMLKLPPKAKAKGNDSAWWKVLLALGAFIWLVSAFYHVAHRGAAEDFSPGDVVFGLGILATGILLYFLPSLIAWHRWHRNANAIVILNFLLGWTLVGWVAALIWAVYEEKPR